MLPCRCKTECVEACVNPRTNTIVWLSSEIHLACERYGGQRPTAGVRLWHCLFPKADNRSFIGRGDGAVRGASGDLVTLVTCATGDQRSPEANSFYTSPVGLKSPERAKFNRRGQRPLIQGPSGFDPERVAPTTGNVAKWSPKNDLNGIEPSQCDPFRVRKHWRCCRWRCHRLLNPALSGQRVDAVAVASWRCAADVAGCVFLGRGFAWTQRVGWA